jgi:ankyrin repeat protein
VGSSPLVEAISCGNAEIVELLLSRGGSPETCDQHSKLPALRAEFAGGSTEWASLLVRHRTSRTVTDAEWRLALLTAVDARQTKVAAEIARKEETEGGEAHSATKASRREARE